MTPQLQECYAGRPGGHAQITQSLLPSKLRCSRRPALSAAETSPQSPVGQRHKRSVGSKTTRSSTWRLFARSTRNCAPTTGHDPGSAGIKTVRSLCG